MKIETYEIEPASNEISTLANDGEHRALCEQLGLKGQLSLSNNESETVFPYPHMTQIEQRVYAIHCPEHTNLQNYKGDAIPVRVLQVAAHAMSCNILNHIQVWHPKQARLDPILVGCTSQYGGDLFILARWGEVWKDFSVLLKEAKVLWAKKRLAVLSKADTQLQSIIKNADSEAELFFQGESIETAIYLSE